MSVMGVHAILYVEDDSNDVFLLTRALKKLGFQNPIFHVEDGARAISYLDGSNGYADRAKFPFPSMMLLDLKLPIKDGFEVLEWLRSRAEFQTLPVVVLSSSDLPEDKGRASQFGVAAYLTKSFDWTNVFTAIHQVLREIP